MRLVFEDQDGNFQGTIELRNGRLIFDDFTAEMRQIHPPDALSQSVTPDSEPERWFYLLGQHFRTPYRLVHLEDDDGNAVPREEYLRLYEQARRSPASEG